MHVGDVVSEEGLTRDRDAIYATGYFYDLYPTFEKVPEGVVLTYNVLENPELKEVKIEGNTVETTESLMELVTVKNGELLNSRTLQENVQAIQEKYRADGYILAKITDLNIAQDGTLTIKISEGVLEDYKVKGNKKTKDYVILREMRQKTGEPFNANLARRSMQRVYNDAINQLWLLHNSIFGCTPHVLFPLFLSESRTSNSTTYYRYKQMFLHHATKINDKRRKTKY